MGNQPARDKPLNSFFLPLSDFPSFDSRTRGSSRGRKGFHPKRAERRRERRRRRRPSVSPPRIFFPFVLFFLFLALSLSLLCCIHLLDAPLDGRGPLTGSIDILPRCSRYIWIRIEAVLQIRSAWLLSRTVQHPSPFSLARDRQHRVWGIAASCISTSDSTLLLDTLLRTFLAIEVVGSRARIFGRNKRPTQATDRGIYKARKE